MLKCLGSLVAKKSFFRHIAIVPQGCGITAVSGGTIAVCAVFLRYWGFKLALLFQ